MHSVEFQPQYPTKIQINIQGQQYLSIANTFDDVLMNIPRKNKEIFDHIWKINLKKSYHGSIISSNIKAQSIRHGRYIIGSFYTNQYKEYVDCLRNIIDLS